MGWPRNTEFRLEVVVPFSSFQNTLGYFNNHYYKTEETPYKEDSVLVVLEGPFKPLEYAAFKAVAHFKLTEVTLEYQGQYSKNPKNKWMRYFVK